MPIADCDIADGFIASGISSCGALRTYKGFADCRLRYRRWLYRIGDLPCYVFFLNDIKLLISILFSKRDPFHILMSFEKAIDEMGGCFARHNTWEWKKY